MSRYSIFGFPAADFPGCGPTVICYGETQAPADAAADRIERAVRERILLAPISSVQGVFENPQFRARGLFRALEDAQRGLSVELPARWANLSGTPLLPPRPAPKAGADTSALLSCETEGSLL